MNPSRLTQISKNLSYWLRHRPDAIGLELDKFGWADISQLMNLAAKAGQGFSFEELREVVKTNDKQRFTLSENCTEIKANQGHSASLKIDLRLKPQLPPTKLYHGTQESSVHLIKKSGLLPMKRQHVHLSTDLKTATKVAARRKGQSTILEINAEKMNSAGFKFYKSENGVWLADEVPAKFITFPKPKG